MDRRYERDSVEFGRPLAFSEGLFAIAMTLPVVAIAVPHITDTHSVHDLANGLNDPFVASIPFAFISTTLAVVIGFLGVPLGALADRWKPEGADELLFG